MLLELHLSGLGVIDDVTLDLAPGLNVLTGETGAGKTMVTVGLTLALGERGRAHVVRDGAGKARVEARFEAGPSLGEWAEDGELVLARTVSADGRSTARAGGQLAPLSTLAELGASLVEVHGQHQAQRLLEPGAQLAFLDRFAGLRERLPAYRRAYARLREVRARLERLDADAREREREKDLLAYQVREIEAVAPEPGEVGALTVEESRLAHAERILERLSGARAALDTAADAAATAAASVAEAADLDAGLESLGRSVASVAAESADALAEARAASERVELDPARLQEVRERRAAIRGLERKYGEGEEGVLAFLEASRGRLGELERAGDERTSLAQELETLEREASDLATAISERRAEAAPRLAEALQAELRDLGMEGSSVEVALPPAGALGPDGLESAELRFSGGAGQTSRPLSKVASGGELSRTMLACRTVLADLDDVPTLVFDEVDAGIGGRAGVAVGRRLARLARSRQVLVVTHLPQIACFADRHFHVSKEKGTARVQALEGDERVEELSRMLSGMPTQEAATHAEQLLEEAAREKAG